MTAPQVTVPRARPILFSAPMILALLAGRKTQTRRIVKPQPAPNSPYDGGTTWAYRPAEGRHVPVGTVGHLTVAEKMGLSCPYGQPGDRLYVKEAAWMWCERRPNGRTKTGKPKWHYVPLREAPVHYFADRNGKPALAVVSPETGNQWGWKLKIARFLPKWASRITLEVTSVRVERLQDISEEDAIFEGVEPTDDYFGEGGEYWRCYRSNCEGAGECAGVTTARKSFETLWEKINGPESWDANPWVWAVGFQVAEVRR